jgi:NADPH2:quinone reductase
VSFTDAAVLPVAASTAYDGLTQLALKPGQTLLVNGIGGGVGVAAAQLARDADLTVVGTVGEGKRELVESLGAVIVVHGDGVADRVREILPEGVDGILDLVGGQALRDVAELVRDASAIVSAGDPATVADVGGAAVERHPGVAVFSAVAALVADGKLDPHVRETFPLTEAGAALQAVETGHARGKIVLTVG